MEVPARSRGQGEGNPVGWKTSLFACSVGALLVVPALASAASADAPARSTGDTVHMDAPARPNTYQAASSDATGQALLQYHGGSVATTPSVYVVFWGSSWNGSGDPKGEQAYLTSFLGGVYNQTDNRSPQWYASTTQYCQGVSSGSTACPSGSQTVGTPAGVLVAGTWVDTGSNPPRRAGQSALANEAVRAANHFGHLTANSQVVVATPHGANPSGFGTQYCAWHSSTSYSGTGGRLAYTNLPYMTDAGASCGENFVNSGSSGVLDGVSIVEGHEYAESITDMFPNGGWLDASGAENGDKCAWISPTAAGGAHDIVTSTGTFAVQTLFSNKDDSTGPCVG